MGHAAAFDSAPPVPDLAFAEHSNRVTELALRLADAVGAGDDVKRAILVGGPLHDIGKLGVPDAILTKPGRLEPEELAEIRKHPAAGARMLDGIESLRHGLGCVRHHHERWDGTGYPDGLAESAIPLEARIVAVADAYDAMISDRPYRAALEREAALAEVDRCGGTQFDPRVAGALLELEI
jgi:HD-GYP domain-containing protein (c-di-GMP phosphodiesterase class II)